MHRLSSEQSAHRRDSRKHVATQEVSADTQLLYASHVGDGDLQRRVAQLACLKRM